MQKIKELGFEFRKTKDETQKDNIETELKNILNDLKKQAIEKFKDESDIKKFLDNIVNFNNYSFNNQMLIYAQRPDCEYVTSFKTIKDMGYSLNAESKGIKVFIPNFMTLVKIKKDDNTYDIKPLFTLTDAEKKKYKDKSDEDIVFYQQRLTGFSLGNVFDVKDTNIPMDVIDKELNPMDEDKRADEIIDCFIKTIYNDGFKVEYRDLGDSSKGFCDHENKLIVLRNGIGSIIKLEVLIHEYAHALAHKHLENNKLDYKEHRNQYETEAESIAYIVAKYLKRPTTHYTLNYLYAWSKEKDFQEIEDSLNTIVNYSKRIINNFEKFYEREFLISSENFESVSI